jgi:ubiquinone/menaquinone biosynthesis C-methylase UbiE
MENTFFGVFDRYDIIDRSITRGGSTPFRGAMISILIPDIIKKRMFYPPLRNLYRYLVFQYRIKAAEIKEWMDRGKAPHPPAPPPELRHRVHGSLDREAFLQVGERLARDINDLCKRAGGDLSSFDHILDFGCGSGRVLRYLADSPETCRWYGSDIDPEMIGWCQKTFRKITFTVNGYQPPLPYHDNMFDLVYGISVFTHFDERSQHAWLGELRRIVKPGFVVILSVHGEDAVGTLHPSLQDRIRSDGFLYVTEVTGRLKLDKLPDFYQTSYHTEDYVRKQWSDYFEIVSYVRRGINNQQDAVILRKR